MLFLEENLTHNSPKYLEWNLAYEKLKRFFLLRHAISSFGIGLNYPISGFQRDNILRTVTILN